MRELFYIGGGIAAGWMIGKALFGEREPVRNARPKWRIIRGSKYSAEFNVVVGDRVIGVIEVRQDTKTQKTNYHPIHKYFNEVEKYVEDEPLGYHDTKEEAAQELYEYAAQHYPGSFQQKEDEPTLDELVEQLPAVSPRDAGSIEPVERISVSMPEWAGGASLWKTPSESFFVIIKKGKTIGFIQGSSGSFWAYTFIGERSVLLANGASRINAIGLVCAADSVFWYLGKQKDLSETSVRSSSSYEDLKTIKTWRPRIVSAEDIANATEIPMTVVESVGKSLAKAMVIFGVSGRVHVAAILRHEETIVPTEEDVQRARSRARRGRKPKIEQRRRRIVAGKEDVEKLRKSETLSSEERRALPKARSVIRYSFALYGPDGSVGMFEAGSRKVKQFLGDERSLEEKERFIRRTKERVTLESEEREKELAAIRKLAVKKPQEHHPLEMTEEETLRELLSRPEGTYIGEFFEEKRLEGLDFVSRRAQDRQRIARKIDRMLVVVDRLEREIDSVKDRIEEAKAKGYSGRLMQAAASLIEKQGKLDEARETLREAQADLQRFQKKIG